MINIGKSALLLRHFIEKRYLKRIGYLKIFLGVADIHKESEFSGEDDLIKLYYSLSFASVWPLSDTKIRAE
jgi:hypothetical protein